MTSLGSKVVLTPGDQVTEAGFYELYSGERELGTYAFNYDRYESGLECYNQQDLETLAGPRASILTPSDKRSLTDLVSERDRGIQLWKWCIVLALLFLLGEIALVRLLRT